MMKIVDYVQIFKNIMNIEEPSIYGDNSFHRILNHIKEILIIKKMKYLDVVAFGAETFLETSWSYYFRLCWWR